MRPFLDGGGRGEERVSRQVDDASGWYPHVTVATVVERDGAFLLVEERDSEGRLVFNQPAGHLEQGEGLIEAAVREALEETGWHIAIDGIVNLSLYTAPSNGVTYHRTTFFGRALRHEPERPLDDGIERAVWLRADEIEAARERLRSPMVAEVVRLYRSGQRHPLSIITG
jgi:ADP-ribose pyrophosphatase YjhB (NUDIX family)